MITFFWCFPSFERKFSPSCSWPRGILCVILNCDGSQHSCSWLNDLSWSWDMLFGRNTFSVPAKKRLLSKPQPQPNLNTTVGFNTKMTLHTPPHPTRHHTNSMLPISQLLLTWFWWNFKSRFMGTFRTDIEPNIEPNIESQYWAQYWTQYWAQYWTIYSIQILNPTLNPIINPILNPIFNIEPNI